MKHISIGGLDVSRMGLGAMSMSVTPSSRRPVDGANRLGVATGPHVR